MAESESIGVRTINLVSTYAYQSQVRGPGKVFENLVRGLERIGQPYVVNRALDSTRWLWIHSDLRALLEMPRQGTVNLLGPNLVILSQDLPTSRPFLNSLYLLPSQWVIDLWAQEGFSQCPLRSWPVGIDTDEFLARPKISLDAPVLVYYKRRSPHGLRRVEDTLKWLMVDYQLLTYGDYTKLEYMKLLHECSFVIWLGCSESQGIALQEALAMDVPILMLNALSLFDQYPSPTKLFPERLRSFRTSAAPYFDSRCGIILDSMDCLKEGLSLMRERLDDFCPREFVLENLSLERQAREFVGFFEELERLHDCDRAGRPAIDARPYRPRLVTRLRLKIRHGARRLTRW